MHFCCAITSLMKRSALVLSFVCKVCVCSRLAQQLCALEVTVLARQKKWRVELALIGAHLVLHEQHLHRLLLARRGG